MGAGRGALTMFPKGREIESAVYFSVSLANLSLALGCVSGCWPRPGMWSGHDEPVSDKLLSLSGPLCHQLYIEAGGCR